MESSLGYRIRAERKRLGFKQSILAVRLGVDKSTISKYENNTLTPPVDILIEMSRLFHRSTDYLLFGEEQRYDDISEKCAELLNDLNKLDDSKCAKLCNCFSDIIRTINS